MISDSSKCASGNIFPVYLACGKFGQQRGIKEIPILVVSINPKNPAVISVSGPLYHKVRNSFLKCESFWLVLVGVTQCLSIPEVHLCGFSRLKQEDDSIISKANITPVSSGLCRTTISKCNMALNSVVSVCMIRVYLQPWRPDSVTK